MMKPNYGYHVPHLILTGLAAGLLLSCGGVMLLAHPGQSALAMALGVMCVIAGAGSLLVSVWLRWLVETGRPMATRRMLDRIQWRGDEEVLDIGCGPGLALIGAAKRLTSGHATGIDKWMILHGEKRNAPEITLENARIEGVEDRVKVIDGDAASLPFQDKSFDVVISGFVFHHLPPEIRVKALQEALRVTRIGGRILIIDDSSGKLARSMKELGVMNVQVRRILFMVGLLEVRRTA